MHKRTMPSHDTPLASHAPIHAPWEHAALKTLSWAGLATAGLAVLPALFSGSHGMAGLASQSAISLCSTGATRGLAGSVASALGELPLIGGTLAAGGFGAVAISVGLAMGSLWLGNYVDRHTAPGAFRYGALIRWAGLATSVLVALPVILPAISMGLMFLGTLWGLPALQDVAWGVGSLGANGAMASISSAMGAAGLAAAHAVTCALPLGLSGFLLGRDKSEQAPPVAKHQLPPVHEGKITPPRLPALAAG